MPGKTRPLQSREERLISYALELEAEEAREAGRLGFMPRMLVQTTLPHRRPKTNEVVRTNGYHRLSMMAPADIGLPFGIYPRLLLIWMTTEAVRTKSSTLVLGNSLSSFMRALGMLPTGGAWGNLGRFKDQMIRLFSTSISCRCDVAGHTSLMNIPPISSADLWWDPKRPEQAGLWESTVVLNPSFYEEVRKHPVPLDVGVLKGLCSSPMAIDLYIWASYRRTNARRISQIPWGDVQKQFGAGYPISAGGRRDFKKNFLKAKKLAAQFDSEVERCLSDGGSALIVRPGMPHISRKAPVDNPVG